MSDQKRQLARKVLVDAVRPGLLAIDRDGLAAEQLVLGTGIQESLLVHRVQGGGGPALGLFQMEPATHDDIWTNFLAFRDTLADQVRALLAPGQPVEPETLKVNDRYAAALCRIRYLRVSPPLPPAGDVAAMADYWKLHYNTPLGAGQPQEFVEKWPLYVDDTTFDPSPDV